MSGDIERRIERLEQAVYGRPMDLGEFLFLSGYVVVVNCLKWIERRCR